MKVLVITGKLAEQSIRRQIKAINHEVKMLVLPVNVAAFITPKYVVKSLKDENLKSYDMIILPGTVNGDVTPVEEATGIKTFKGPLHSAELSLILNEELELSKTIPASELITDLRRERAKNEINEVELNWEEVLDAQGGILIGKRDAAIPVGNGFPMRVIAEIVNAPLLTSDEIKQRAIYYDTQEADIIDIGMLAGYPKPEKIPQIISIIRKAVDLPLSIDTLDPSEIKSSIEVGIDLILSLDAGNMESVAPNIGDEAVVVLPTNMSKSYLPHNFEERVRAQERNIEKANSFGITNLIADLVVEPLLNPGLLETLKAYQYYHKKHPKTPILFGIGNAVELIDADSTGVSSTLSALAREAGANMLHVPEHSVKARGNVNEMVRASRMMFLAQRRETMPKDLGIDLLILKEKRWKEEKYYREIEAGANVYDGIFDENFFPDETGWFKIQIDRINNLIVALHYPPGKTSPENIIKGKNAVDVYQTIIRNKFISELNHAAYLGSELEKAAIALELDRSYVQDEPVFNRI
jgi:dihydropteroate synthase-like protein